MIPEDTAPTLRRPTGVTASAGPTRPAGVAIGRYTIVKLLGRGGMGDVYLAHDPQLARPVAIKLLSQRADPSRVSDRLRREAIALARLAHPNVVAVHEVGEAEGQVYLVMERVDGATLRSWLAAAKRGPGEVLAALLQAGRGLAAAHAAGLAHRDFKPDNVMVGVDGRVRVMDFGLACAIDSVDPELAASSSSSTSSPEHFDVATSVGRGTPGYMAPEQYLGAAMDARCDIFSFCVVLFEALHGRRPFAGDTASEVQQAVMRGERVRTRDRAVAPWLDAALVRGLARDPAQRWSTMDELLAALGRGPPARGRRLWRGVGWLALIAVVAVVVGQAVHAARQTAAQDQTERLAEERLAVAEDVIRRAGDSEVAAATFASFVDDPAHRGTRALVRAWRNRGDQRRAAGADDEAVNAYGRAYLEADAPAEAAALMRTLAGMFRERRDGPALAQALATLHARGLDDAADAALAFDAAALQGDLAGAVAALERGDEPEARAWGALLTALAHARRGGSAASQAVALPAGGAAALVVRDTSGHEVLLLDRSLAPVGRLRADGRHLALVDDAAWVFTVADGQGALLDLAAPETPLWRGPSASWVFHARAVDVDGDGARELLFGRAWPDLGFRGLFGLGGAAAVERPAHATTDASGSELSALWQGDLDGDGEPEIVAAMGPWSAFDLRVFHGGPDGALTLRARRQFGRVTGLTAVRRGPERLLAVLGDDSCPSRELFPTPPHTGAPAGVHLMRWDGDELRDVAFSPLPGAAASTVMAGRIFAADLDGDAVEELVYELSRGATGVTVLARQTAAGLVAREFHGLRPLAVAQLDEDPALELLVRAAPDDATWALGAGDALLPRLAPPAAAPLPPPPSLDDPLLVERWVRADELAGVGLTDAAAASLTAVVGFAATAQARRDLLDRAADLLVRADDDVAAVALTRDAELAPGAAALARDAAALARLGRYDEADEAATAAATHPGSSPAQVAAAVALRARLAPLIAPGARVDLDFTGPLDEAWQVRRPAGVVRDPGRHALELTVAADERPVVERPIAWDGDSLAIEYELDLERLEYGACLRVGLVDADGEYWLGAGVCAIGGGGRLLQLDRCKLAGTGWSEFRGQTMASATVDRHLVVRVAAFADGTATCSVDDGVHRRHMTETGARLPLPGPQRLAFGAFTAGAEPTLARGLLRRITIHGARAAPPGGERSPRDDAARALVEGDPAAALAALDLLVVTDPRDDLLRVLAYNDLHDPVGLKQALPGLQRHLDDPDWRADVTVLLRTRPAVAMALYQAAGARLLPALALAWAVTRSHARDPEIQRSTLAELGGIDHMRPETPEQRLALRDLLVMRAGIREELGHHEQARRDLEAALAVPPTELADDVEARALAHLQLASLLVGSEPAVARAHAAEAAAISARPELIHDRIAAIPGLRR